MLKRNVTATMVAKIKKQAKDITSATGIPHSAALEQASIAAGFDSWFAVCDSHKSTSSSADTSDFPVDPKLPPHFYNKRNESRTANELAQWWDHPFAKTIGDGTYVVHCLDGGAWDRPTNYGVANSLEEARALAKEKLSAWQAFRRRPYYMAGEEFKSTSVVRMPQHPHGEVEILGTFPDQQAAKQFVDGLDDSKDK